MAGFFFCLASANGAGLLFCPAAMQPIQAFTARFVLFMQLYSSHSKTAHVALQALFLRFSLFHRPRYQNDTSGYNTTCDTLEHITATQHLQRIPDTIATPRRCIAQHSRPIIIMYIRAYPCYRSMPDCATYRRPCKPGGSACIRLASCTGSARRLAILHRVSLAPSTRRGSPAAGARRAELLAACRRFSFRAVAR